MISPAFHNEVSYGARKPPGAAYDTLLCPYSKVRSILKVTGIPGIMPVYDGLDSAETV